MPGDAETVEGKMGGRFVLGITLFLVISLSAGGVFGAAPPAPSTPDLDAASDTGTSDSDDITNAMLLTFTGTAEADSTVELFSDWDGSLGTQTASGGIFSLAVSLTSGPGERTHGVTATATNLDGTSPQSTALLVHIDRADPTISGVTLTPSSGYRKVGDPVGITATEGSLTVGLTASSASFNGQAVALADQADGTYAGIYTVVEGHSDAANPEATGVTLTDVAGNTSAAGASSGNTLVIDANSPAKPGIPDLDAASDNGQSTTDDVTNDDTPTFDGIAGSVEGNSTVGVTSSIDGPLGTASANADGSWTCTVLIGSELADGSHAVTITATDGAGNVSSSSDPLSVLIDTQPPNDPGNRAPADSAWVDTTSPTFSWDAPGDPGGSGVYNYRVQVWGPATRDYYTPNLSYNPSLGAQGTYTWRLYALDVAGNNGDVGASTWTLNVDTTDPSATVTTDHTTILPTGPAINENSLTLTVTVVYDEAMNQTTTPTITLPSGGAHWGAQTPVGATGWQNATTYQATFTHDGAEEEIIGVALARVSDTSGATDLAGNADVGDDSPLFDIDTDKPSATVTTDHTTILPTGPAINENSLTLTVTVVYDEAMNQTTTPTITLPSGGAHWGAQTPVGATGWQNATTYQATFTHDGAEEEIIGVALARVSDTSGATDLAGNADVGDDSPLFDIDTDKPSATVTTDHTTIANAYGVPATNPIYEGSLVLTATVTYDEDMDTSTTPTISLVGATSARWTGPTGGSWNGTPDSYTATFTHDGVDDEVAGVFVRITDSSGATDEATNADVGDDSLPFDVDTTKPTILLIEVEETAGFCGTSCYSLARPPSEFDATIDFSESVWQGAGNELILTFDLDSSDWLGAPASADGNTLSFSGIGPDNTSATTVWQPQDEIRTNVVENGDNSCDLAVIAISLAGSLFDVAGNAFVIPALDATNNVTDAQDVSVDTTKPLISNLMFNTDGTYAVGQTVPYPVNECGLVVVYFSATVTDNCSILAGNVNVSVTLPMLAGEGFAIIEDIVVNPMQNGQDRVDITGNAVVRCLESCPPNVCMSRVQVDVTATDCGGNEASPAATDAGEGLVNDDILPIPRDDPRQDMMMDESAVIDPLVEVRLDELGTYRLILRENTPVRIDVMGNDADNLSHNAAHPFAPCIACGSCSGQTGCCAVMYIHEIVEPPSFGTATIEEETGDCNGGTVIRYAPDQGRLGPDYFTYRTRDAFDNVSSVIATVYLQTVEETVMEDVAVIACSGQPTESDVVAADLWVDRDPVMIPFGFEIIGGPMHGVVVGDPTQIVFLPPSLGPDPNTGQLVPTLDFTEAARIRLTYTSAVGYIGRDTMMIRVDDPFGAFAIAEVDIRVIECAPGDGGVPMIEVVQGAVLPIIVPESFVVVVESTPGAVILMSLESGRFYTDALSCLWSEDLNRYVLVLDTGPLPLGRYLATIPLGNGDRVELIIEVGEPE